jgi:hypothetical protein
MPERSSTTKHLDLKRGDKVRIHPRALPLANSRVDEEFRPVNYEGVVWNKDAFYQSVTYYIKVDLGDANGYWFQDYELIPLP